jgi:hypothetical protein
MIWTGILWALGTIECLIAIVLFAEVSTPTWSREEKISAFGLMLNLLTFGGAAVGVAIAYGAYVQTQRQAEEARRQADAAVEQLVVAKADQRPWLDISKIAVAGDVSFDENGARVEINFEIANVGRTPAFDVMPWTSASLLVLRPDKEKRYQIPPVSILVPAEGIAFPGRPVGRTAIAYASTQEVREAMNRPGRVFPVVVEVCVAYRNASSTEEHKTCHTLLLVARSGLLLLLGDHLVSIAKDEVKVTYRDRESIAY